MDKNRNRVNLDTHTVSRLKKENARKAAEAIEALINKNGTKAEREAILNRHDAIGKALDNLKKELDLCKLLKLEVENKYEWTEQTNSMADIAMECRILPKTCQLTTRTIF